MILASAVEMIAREHGVKSKVRHKPHKMTGSQRAPGARNSTTGTRNRKAPSVKVRLIDWGHPTDIAADNALLWCCNLQWPAERLLKEYTVCWKILTTGIPRTYSVPALAIRSWGRLIFRHQPGVFAAHHAKHSAGLRSPPPAGRRRAHPPVKDKHQHQHGQKQGDGPYDIGQIVGQ